MGSGDKPQCCSEKFGMTARSLLSNEQGSEIATLFKLMGNQTRLRMIHALVRAGEISVSELAAVLNMKPQAISNQLQRLLNRNMLACRRQGSHILYRIVDPCLVSLLDTACCLLEDLRERADGSRKFEAP